MYFSLLSDTSYVVHEVLANTLVILLCYLQHEAHISCSNILDLFEIAAVLIQKERKRTNPNRWS